MTREEAINMLKSKMDGHTDTSYEWAETVRMAINALEQEPCEDAISRQAVLEAIDAKAWEFCDYLISKNRNDEQKPVSHFADNLRECVSEELPPVNPQQKTGHCKDCKWWKDSDGMYRRGVFTESQCPMDRREVFEGNGYCFMFEPQERSE